MEQRTIGRNGLSSSALGLGCMGMSDLYGPADEQAGIDTIRAALDAGVTLLDTGDFYGMGHNEMLIREALGSTGSTGGNNRDTVHLSVKFGAMRDAGGNWVGMDNRPEAVKNFLAYTLRRLGTDHIDIYRPARLDPNVPIEDTVGAIAEEIKAGRVRHIGLSEVGANTLRRAHAVHPITDLQIEYSLISRGIEKDILPTCRELGIGITAYGVLSRGLISGHWDASRQLATNDFRSHSPRFSGENLAHNLSLIEVLHSVAADKEATPAQIAIAWVLAQGSDIVPLVGARRPERLAESLGALKLALTAQDLARIEAAIPADAAAGGRYAAHAMAHLDSEK
jgi:aryl-alcohol dehydrogenase-like predicted oxidoreductase